MAWALDKAKPESNYSTLEVSGRGDHSTLEVDPRQYYSGLEVKPSDRNSAVKSAGESQSPTKQQPWWKRYWLVILVLSILVTGGIVGGAVGGSLASQQNSDKDTAAEESITTSNVHATSTTSSSTTEPQTTSSHSSTTVTTSTTTSFSKIKPTATPAASDTPRFPIYIGEGDEDGDKFRLAYVVDGTRNASCKYGIIPASIDENPCGNPFLLADGFEYMWNGCGGDTWATWRNPSSDDNEYHMLHDGPCEFKARSFDCDGTVVTGAWLCGNSTA